MRMRAPYAHLAFHCSLVCSHKLLNFIAAAALARTLADGARTIVSRIVHGTAARARSRFTSAVFSLAAFCAPKNYFPNANQTIKENVGIVTLYNLPTQT